MTDAATLASRATELHHCVRDNRSGVYLPVVVEELAALVAELARIVDRNAKASAHGCVDDGGMFHGKCRICGKEMS